MYLCWTVLALSIAEYTLAQRNLPPQHWYSVNVNCLLDTSMRLKIILSTLNESSKFKISNQQFRNKRFSSHCSPCFFHLNFTDSKGKIFYVCRARWGISYKLGGKEMAPNSTINKRMVSMWDTITTLGIKFYPK